jgi:hypothetical protein
MWCACTEGSPDALFGPPAGAAAAGRRAAAGRGAAAPAALQPGRVPGLPAGALNLCAPSSMGACCNAPGLLHALGTSSWHDGTVCWGALHVSLRLAQSPGIGRLESAGLSTAACGSWSPDAKACPSCRPPSSRRH